MACAFYLLTVESRERAYTHTHHVQVVYIHKVIAYTHARTHIIMHIIRKPHAKACSVYTVYIYYIYSYALKAVVTAVAVYGQWRKWRDAAVSHGVYAKIAAPALRHSRTRRGFALARNPSSSPPPTSVPFSPPPGTVVTRADEIRLPSRHTSTTYRRYILYINIVQYI